MSDLSVLVDPELPPLAWLLRWDTTGATLICGSWVETTPTSWVEGCWDGDFADMAPEGHWLAGTAGRLESDRLTLTPPFHSFDAIYLLRRHGSIHASNSLPFLIEASGAKFRRHHVNLHTDFARVVYGLDEPHLRIRMAEGDVLEVIYLLPIAVGLTSSGERYGALPEALPFADFEGYHAFLRRRTQRLVANGTTPTRKAVLRPITTVSSGYDSPAVAALARGAGATTALTISRSRGARDADGENDSGVPVAEALGLAAVTFERDTRWVADGEPVIAEFLASGMSGEELPLRVMADHLRGTVLFSGYYGDSAWSRQMSQAHRLQRGDLGGSSLTEFRLRAGFSHLPLPFLGAVRQSELARISCSEEMFPWSIGGAYDRPIPRRLAEAAGVPRHAFGVAKRAVTSVSGRRELPDSTIREAVLAIDRETYKVPLRIGTSIGAWVLSSIHPARMKIRAIRRRLRRPGTAMVLTSVSQRRAATLHGPHAVPTFLWALDLIGRERYRSSVRSLESARGDGRT